MIVSGSYTRLISRQPEQTLLDVGFELNPADVISFGLSGSGSVGVSVSGGVVFDAIGRNIYAGKSGDKIEVKVLQDNNYATYYVNKNLLSFTTGDYSFFDYLYCSSSIQKDFDIFVSGVQPVLDYSGVNAFDENQYVLTGAVLNTTPDKRFRIFSGDIIKSVPDVFLSGWETGDIINSGNIYIGFSGTGIYEATGDIVVDLYTNFGTVQIPINLESNATNHSSFFTISPSGVDFFDQFGIFTYTVDSYYNFGSRVMGASLEFISGGASYPEVVDYTGMGTGYLYGTISGTGFATGLISGYVNTTPSTYYLSGITGFFTVTGLKTGTMTGTMTGEYSGDLYTGLFNSGYSITLTSGDSGVWASQQGTGSLAITHRYFSGSGDYEQPTFLDTGIYTGYYTRNVPTGNLNYILTYLNLSTPIDPSDFFYFYYNFSSIIEFTHGVNFSGMSGLSYIYTGATSVPNTDVSGTFPFSCAPLIFTGAVNDVGIRFPIYSESGANILATGVFNSKTFTELINTSFNSGLTSGRLESTGSINFEDIWGFQTGRNRNFLIDHNYYGYYNSTGYVHSGSNAILRKDFINHNIIEISYNGDATSGTNVARLLLTDGVENISFYISGTGRLL